MQGVQLGEKLAEQLVGLNASQRCAIQVEDGPVLVSAGAGTGKTRVLTLRYAHLVHQCGVAPHEILAVTFTNKAAQEMKSRLEALLFLSTQKLWVGTFHSLSLRMLRSHADLVKRTPTFAVLDFGDQQSIVQKILKEKSPRKQDTPRSILHSISQWKQKTWAPEDVPTNQDAFCRSVYEQYHHQLQFLNAFDFDDLLLESLRLFRREPTILASYHQQFPHILVDEYQDVNGVQYGWLQALAEGARGIFCVGDDDQSIYGWRGADVDTMMRFSKDFPGAQVICLEHNYRSTPHILSAASQLIARNKARYGKVLHTDQTEGEKVQVQGVWDTQEEASFIAGKIQARATAGETFASMAVLVRTGAQTREFEERFLVQKIPYRLVGNMRFYERQEVRDFLGYLRLTHSSTDNMAFERIINTPKRGIGLVAMQNLHSIALDQGCSLEAASALLCQTLKDSLMKRELSHFLGNLKAWREVSEDLSLSHLAERILTESGYLEFWKSQGSIAEARVENLKELVKAMGNFTTLEDFLEHVNLLLEVGSASSQDSVSVLTLHAAKGLEFDTVFLAGWEENVFPHIRSVEAGAKGVEEERRLAYVGLTRARKNSTITFCWNRRMHQGWMSSAPSCFIQELPPEDVVISLHQRPHGQSGGPGPSTFQPIPLRTDPLMGQRVSHPIFGHGTVQESSGQTVSVFFDTQGTKKVVSRFLDKL